MYTPEGLLIGGGLDSSIKILDEHLEFSTNGFASRTILMSGAIYSLSTAPIHCRFCNVIAIGTKDGLVHFLDLSWNSQQPLYHEAVKLIEGERALHKVSTYEATKTMVVPLM